jgi:hypothetical protein
MRSECMAAPPQFACCYTWKLPATRHMRPVLLDHNHGPFSRTDSRPRRKACRAEHPSIPWKAYLASREFQNLASDIADAVFAPSSSRQISPDAERPLSLGAGSHAPGSRDAGKPSTGLLARILPEPAGQAPGLAMAA